MNPWVHTKRKVIRAPSGAALSARAFALRLGSAAPKKGLNKCTTTNNPGLAPWAMKKYRPVGALLHLVVMMVVTRRASDSLCPTKNGHIVVMLGTLQLYRDMMNALMQ